MSYDLISKKVGHIKLSIHTWPKLLDLARMYGWEPVGTKFDESFLKKIAKEAAPSFMPKKMAKKAAREWLNHKRARFDPNDYMSNDAQKVTRKDALALAAALRESLDDIPDILDIDKSYTFSAKEMAERFGPGFLAAIEQASQEAGGPDSGDPAELTALINPNLHPLEYFGGEEKPWLESIIGYFEHGAFYIF